jgi:hypothetical protein
VRRNGKREIVLDSGQCPRPVAEVQQCFVSGQTMLNQQQVVNMSPNATNTTTVPK